MPERRPLIEGLKTPPVASRDAEKQFVFGEKASLSAETTDLTAQRPAATISRVQFTSRLRSDLAQAIKRASLERQLGAIEPNTVQDILENALEHWLQANGYLPGSKGQA